MSTELSVRIRAATNADCGPVRDLVFGVLAEYGLEPDEKGIDGDLFDLEAGYTGRGGVFELLEDPQGRLIGTVGLYPVDSVTVELRKMYLVKDYRGKGLGKRILRRMIAASRSLGFRRITLETAAVLTEAVGLYKSFGFLPDDTVHSDRCDRSFYLDLA